jgi:hypothetical protein|tara:strand:- start:3574 stop:3792 length:219 start_codon:yes stop_codon:yes gene_type:complete
MIEISFTITIQDVKNICDSKGYSFDEKDYIKILKDIKRIYELNIKQDINEYIEGQAFNHMANITYKKRKSFR